MKFTLKAIPLTMLIATLPLAARAQVAVVVETISPTSYVHGRIGQDEDAPMRSIVGEFPRHMTFSERKRTQAP